MGLRGLKCLPEPGGHFYLNIFDHFTLVQVYIRTAASAAIVIKRNDMHIFGTHCGVPA